MAKTIYLKDGSTEYVFDTPKEFLAKLIFEKLGADATRLFNEYANEIEDELKYANELKDDAERVSDGYLALCRDALDSMRELKDILRCEHVDRLKLSKLIDNVYTNLNNNL